MSKIAPDKLAKQLAALRRKKLRKIKNKVQSGKYRIDNWDLAKALFLSQ